MRKTKHIGLFGLLAFAASSISFSSFASVTSDLQNPQVNDIYAVHCSLMDEESDIDPENPYCMMRLTHVSDTTITGISADRVWRSKKLVRQRLGKDLNGTTSDYGIDWLLKDSTEINRSELLELKRQDIIVSVRRLSTQEVEAFITAISRREL